MPSPKLCVIIITLNAQAHLDACLRSVAFADAWVVLDSGSTDDTVKIAQARGAQLVHTPDWPGFGPQKNRALARAQTPWVLSLDADEHLSAELAAQIQAIVQAPITPQTPQAYALPRLSRFCGQWMRHGDWYPDKVVRLFQRGHAQFSADLVHERLVVQGRTQQLSGQLLHETMPTLEDALHKMNRYTTGRAQDKHQRGQRGGLARALSHGFWAFWRSYLFKRGFLDGQLGLVLAVYIAENTYYRYLKMGLLAQPTKECSTCP